MPCHHKCFLSEPCKADASIPPSSGHQLTDRCFCHAEYMFEPELPAVPEPDMAQPEASEVVTNAAEVRHTLDECFLPQQKLAPRACSVPKQVAAHFPNAFIAGGLSAQRCWSVQANQQPSKQECSLLLSLQEAPVTATQANDRMEDVPAEGEPLPPGPLQRVQTQSEASLVRDQSGKELTVMKTRGGEPRVPEGGAALSG